MDIVLVAGICLVMGVFAGMGWGYAIGVIAGQKQLGPYWGESKNPVPFVRGEKRGGRDT